MSTRDTDSNENKNPVTEKNPSAKPVIEKAEKESTSELRRALLKAGWAVPVVTTLGLPKKVYAGHADSEFSPTHFDLADHDDTPHSDGTMHNDLPDPHQDAPTAHEDSVHADTPGHIDDTTPGPHADIITN